MVIWSTNIRGIRTNFDQLRIRIDKIIPKPDLVFLNETLINQTDVADSEYQIPGYCLLRFDRPNRGGGHARYYRGP